MPMFRTIALTLMMVASLAASGLVPPDLTANNFILVREGDVCEGDVLMIGAYDYLGKFYFLSQKFVKDKVKLGEAIARVVQGMEKQFPQIRGKAKMLFPA